MIEQIHSCRVCGVAEMSGLAISQDVVPTVEGVTDEESIADWDPPFPFERERVRTTAPHDEDDKYWKRYKAVPKIFMPLQRARDIAGSRFGQTTAWHLSQAGTDQQHLLSLRLAAGIPPESVGLRVLPLKFLASSAAKGSTPFGILFFVKLFSNFSSSFFKVLFKVMGFFKPLNATSKASLKASFLLSKFSFA